MRLLSSSWQAFILFPLLLNGCVGIKHEKGLLIASKDGLNLDDSDEYPFATEDPDHLNGDLFLPKGAPITVRLGGKPLKKHFVLVGPLILPVIPWPVGIVQASLKNNWKEPGNVQVALGLNRYDLRWRNKEITKLTFDPNRVGLKVKDRSIRLISGEATAYDVYQATSEKRSRRDMTAECISKSKSGETIFDAANKQCRGMTLKLTYDMPYSDLREGTLQIDGVEINGTPAQIQAIALSPGGRFKTWGSLPSFND